MTDNKQAVREALAYADEKACGQVMQKKIKRAIPLVETLIDRDAAIKALEGMKTGTPRMSGISSYSAEDIVRNTALNAAIKKLEEM